MPSYSVVGQRETRAVVDCGDELGRFSARSCLPTRSTYPPGLRGYGPGVNCGLIILRVLERISFFS